MREYVALPHEYWEEMADLTDEEFGRLVRALLQYSMTGEESDLPGTERLFWPRVKNREGRYQVAFEETSEKRRAAARVRWDREREMQCNALQCNTNTNTNSNSETKAKTNSYSNSRRSKERREAAAAAAYGERLKKDVKWLEEFCQETGDFNICHSEEAGGRRGNLIAEIATPVCGLARNDMGDKEGAQL